MPSRKRKSNESNVSVTNNKKKRFKVDPDLLSAVKKTQGIARKYWATDNNGRLVKNHITLGLIPRKHAVVFNKAIYNRRSLLNHIKSSNNVVVPHTRRKLTAEEIQGILRYTKRKDIMKRMEMVAFQARSRGLTRNQSAQELQTWLLGVNQHDVSSAEAAHLLNIWMPPSQLESVAAQTRAILKSVPGPLLSTIVHAGIPVTRYGVIEPLLQHVLERLCLPDLAQSALKQVALQVVLTIQLYLSKEFVGINVPRPGIFKQVTQLVAVDISRLLKLF